jgi:Reverse transcriptase (RNA-dependent DNA polymerase)
LASNEFTIHATELLDSTDPRTRLPAAEAAKKKEIEQLVERGTWRLAHRSEFPKDANVFGARFVISVKNSGDEDEVFKARYVVQVHRDREKATLVKSTPPLRQSSIRLLVFLGACFGFQIFSTDISQAYLQRVDALLRNFYLNPGKEFEISSERVLQLLLPLYGLSDSGDAWAKTFTNHMTSDLGMVSTIADISLFSKVIHGKVAGLAGNYVDDTISCGN